MLSMEDRRLKKQAEEERRQMMQHAMFVGKMKRIAANQKQMSNAIEQHRRKAIEAERSGQHAQAVRYAGEMAHMERELKASVSLKDSLERAHTISENTQTMVSVMRGAGELMGSIGPGVSPQEMIEARTELTMKRQQLDVMLEQQSMMSDMYTDDDDASVPDEQSEEALRRLMAANKPDRSRQTLADTKRRLDELEALHRSRNDKEDQ